MAATTTDYLVLVDRVTAGGRVIWTTPDSPPGVEPDGGGVGYNKDILESTRTATGWIAEWLTPTAKAGTNNQGPTFVDATDDGQRLLVSSDVPLSDDDTDTKSDMYVIAPDGSAQLITGSTSAVLVDSRTAARSSDLSVVSWQTTEKLLPGSDHDTLNDVYARDASGVLHHVSVGSDGADPGISNVVKTVSYGSAADLGMVSDDGRRIFFETNDPLDPADDNGAEDVYMRLDFAQTVRVTPALDPALDTSEWQMGVARIAGVTPDGRYVFVVSDRPLDGDNSGPGTHLFRIDLVGDEVRRVSTADVGFGTFLGKLLAWSADGQHVVFPSEGIQDAADNDGENSIYRWDAGVTRYLGPATGTLANLTGLWYGKRPVRMSADGRVVAFTTSSPLTGDDTDSTEDVYVDRDGALTRISKGAAGGNGEIDAHLAGAHSQAPQDTTGRGMTTDGSHVYFTTAEALVAEDRNNTSDVYGWSDDGLELITPGNAEYDAEYVDNSANGNDVFFRTQQSFDGLVGSYPGVWDARVGGGFPLPPPPPASTVGAPVSSAGGGGSPSGPTSPASSTAGNSGNEVPPRVSEPGDQETPAPRSVRPANRSAAVKGRSAAFAFDLPSPGRLTVTLTTRPSAGAKAKRLARVSRTFQRAGRSRVALRLPLTVRRQVARRGRLKLVVSTTFTPSGGQPLTTRRTATLAARRTNR